MTLDQLRVFVAVAEREHMTQAAAALHLAQSAVSASIAALEREYGIRLFDRIGRNIRLTEGGRVFLAEARTVLDQVGQAGARIRSYAEASKVTRAASLDCSAMHRSTAEAVGERSHDRSHLAIRRS